MPLWRKFQRLCERLSSSDVARSYLHTHGAVRYVACLYDRRWRHERSKTEIKRKFRQKWNDNVNGNSHKTEIKCFVPCRFRWQNLNIKLKPKRKLHIACGKICTRPFTSTTSGTIPQIENSNFKNINIKIFNSWIFTNFIMSMNFKN